MRYMSTGTMSTACHKPASAARVLNPARAARGHAVSRQDSDQWMRQGSGADLLAAPAAPRVLSEKVMLVVPTTPSTLPGSTVAMLDAVKGSNNICTTEEGL